ncbi:hypothetical protein [Nocardiopsis aegyptia]|uniref:DUF4352 domain-containing protein n=1 Tax=Nocardiopsis aegyptia TaxID=220378 RepID=A0A7Z0J9T8_9ACTN|nr:hypothetical protein [Nocardiopsis aegyptia]NYJ33724.1 hypothetical protein [Nocardiopsis aegyptia]
MSNLSLARSATGMSLAVSIIVMGMSSASAAPRSSDLEVLGSVEGNSAESEGLTAEVNEAERDESGALLSITWSISNNGDSTEPLVWLRDRSYSYSGPNYAGVTSRSNESGTRFHPIMDGNGACLCSGPTSNDLAQQVSPGEKVSYWSLFSVPSDIESVTVEIPNFEPIEDVPIS